MKEIKIEETPLEILIFNLEVLLSEQEVQEAKNYMATYYRKEKPEGSFYQQAYYSYLCFSNAIKREK